MGLLKASHQLQTKSLKAYENPTEFFTTKYKNKEDLLLDYSTHFQKQYAFNILNDLIQQYIFTTEDWILT